jgi:hypothetical protein
MFYDYPLLIANNAFTVGTIHGGIKLVLFYYPIIKILNLYPKHKTQEHYNAFAKCPQKPKHTENLK